ncbi:MAG: SGNH/GDSL hydrolase family protein [Actinoallomurus sp.]
MSDVIVFIGDSITDCERRTDPLGLGGGYVDVIADTLRERGDDSTVVNTGVSGDRIEHLQQRWQTDALDHRPSVLSIFIGVNDTLIAFYEGRSTPPDRFERSYTDILERTAEVEAPKLIIVEPFVLDTGDPAAQWSEGAAFAREDLDTKRPIVRDLAERHGATFLPLQAALSAAAKERGPAAVAGDGVHPSALGHRLIARLWLEAYDALT